MRTEHAVSEESEVQTSLSILQHLLNNYHPRNFSIRLWDGTMWEQEQGCDSRFTLVLQHPGALRKMFLHISEVTLGEAYVYDDFDVEGDIEAVFPMAEYLFRMQLTVAEKIHLGTQLLKLPSGEKPRNGRQAVQLQGPLHSKERDKKAVTYHYNVSNDFFKLWLDKNMVYSCAYFNSADEDLDTAQERKLDYVCRKLRLMPGDRLLDFGCGWGGLIIHAGKKFGVNALGITLSEPQAQFARARIEEEGLTKNCRVEVRDYRDIHEPEAYDKIVSIGMVEHVGESMLQQYFQSAWNLLRHGGVFLNHGIASGLNHVKSKIDSFSNRYIFPDSEFLPIQTTLRTAEMAGFEVRDVESLREHYAMTLRHWNKRLEAHRAEACSVTDEATYRTWRLNHAGAALGFDENKQTIYQTLFVKPDRNQSKFPLTRADWYK